MARQFTTCKDIQVIFYDCFQFLLFLNVEIVQDWVSTLKVFSNGYLASGSNDQTVKIWNPLNGTQLYDLTGHTYKVKVLETLSNGNLASGAWDNTIKIWYFQQ